MKPFFSEPDLGRCFMELTAYQKVIKGAYRLAGLLLQETLNKGRQAAVLTLAHLQVESGLSGPTVKEHLEILKTAGIFPSLELGAGAHKEVLCCVGTALGLELLQHHRAGQLSIAELLERAQLNSKKLSLSENNFEMKEILEPPENNLAQVKETLPSSEQICRSDSEPDLTKSVVQISEADKVSETAEHADTPAQQLSFGTNLAADMGETVLPLAGFHSQSPPVADPPPAGPAEIVPIRSVSEPAAVGGLTGLKDGLRRMGFNPDVPIETDGDRLRRQAQKPLPAVPAAPSPRFLEEQLQIAQIQTRGVGVVVRELHAQYIHPPSGGFSSWEPQRVQEFIEDLERADARLLLLLKPGFERASAKAESVAAARINVSRAAREQFGISFAERRPKRAS